MRSTLFFLFCFLVFDFLSAQVCLGNLGENIFTAGDFGSGVANVPPDPGIAPGYIYESNPAPQDGLYTITNDISQWAVTFGWEEIQDNSSDPNGYMMVVNASYEPGLFYEQQVDDLCENTLYVFEADIYNLISPGGNAIKPNVSFLLDGAIQFSTGDIPENATWNTYGFTFVTAPGQTSLTLALANNAPGGNGNDLALDNITFRACGPEALILPLEIANICEDGSPIGLDATVLGEQYDTPTVQWQQSFDEGLTWADIPGATGLEHPHTDLNAGFYYYRYLLANAPANLLNPNCRVVSNVKIVNVVPKFYTIVDTLCQGGSFALGDNLFDASGVYEDSLLTTLGCDSIVTLELTVLPDASIDAAFTLRDPGCDYSSDGAVLLDSVFNGTPPYDLEIDGLPGGGGDMVNLPAGLYNYRITDKFGCFLDTTLTLVNPPPFIVDIGDDRDLALGESVSFNPFFSSTPDNFGWALDGLPVCDPLTDDCEKLTLTPPRTAYLSLTATTDGGCVATDSVLVRVRPVREVYLPSAFSPNEDGVNDRFTVFGGTPNIVTIEEFRVFDRWGGQVFARTDFAPSDLSQGWDGTARGQLARAGVYAYVARVRFLDGEVWTYEGAVHLLR